MKNKLLAAFKLLLVVVLVVPVFLQAAPAAFADSGWSSNLNGWSKKEGNDWLDEAGGKRIASDGKNTLLLAEGSWADFQYEADVTFKAAKGHTSLLFRADAGGWGSYKLQLEPSLNEIRLTGADGLFQKFNPETPLAVDTSYHLKVVAAGSSIKVYLGENEHEQLLFDVTNAERTTGHLGVLVWDGDVLLQNVNASEIVPPESTFVTNLTGWSYSGDAGTYEEQSEGLLLSSAGNYFGIAETTAANFEYEADIKLASNEGVASLVFRSNDNGWGSYMVQLDPLADKLRLLDANDQAVNRLYEEYSVAIEPATFYHVRIKAQGDRIEVYWNDEAESAISAIDSAYESGRLGLHLYNAGAVFQHVTVKELGTAYPPVSTNLTGWTTLDNGTLEETTAGLKLTSAGNYFAISDRTAADFSFEADVKLENNEGLASLVFRSNDNGWGSYMVQLAPRADSPGMATLRLINADDAAVNRLYEEVEVALAADAESNHIKLEAVGSRLTVYWNGGPEPALSATDAAYASGRLGLHIYNASATFQHIFVDEQALDFSQLKSNLQGWQLRETGEASSSAAGLTLSSAGYFAALAAEKTADIQYEANVRILTEQAAAALLLRADNSGRSGYMVQVDHKAQKLRLVSLNGTEGSELLTEAATTIETGRSYKLRVKMEGNLIKVYWNGKYDPLLQASSATYAEGRLGLHSFGGAVQFQNVNVSELVSNIDEWHSASGIWQPNLHGIQGKSSGAADSNVVNSDSIDSNLPGSTWALRIGDAPQATQQGNFVLEGDVLLEPETENVSGALLLRASTDGGQGYLVALRSDGSVALLKKNGSTVTVEQSSSTIPLAAGKTHHVEIVAQDASLTVYVDGYATPAIQYDGLTPDFGGSALGLAVAEGSAYFQNVNVTALADYYNELYRPQYHYSPAQGAASDPNGLVYFNGEYHLFHQDGGQWAHAISTDLLHWKRMPVALSWNELGHIWSGSAVADLTNASGLFGDSGGQGLIAYYTSFHPDKQGGNQKIGLAYSKDNGRTWAYYGNEAVVQNPGGIDGGWDFRDPKVVRDEANNRWVMVVSGGDNVHFLTSTNLIDWQRTDQFGFNEISVGGEWQEGVWECPDFFPLTVEGSTTQKWVLLLSTGANPKTQGSESRYFIGEFSAEGKFINDNPVRTMLKIEYGKEMYASMTFDNEPDGRRIMMAWMTNWDYPFSFPTSPWKGTLTIPRELYLVDTAEGIRLAQRPLQQLASLRGEALEWNNVTVTAATENLLSDFSGSAYEIEAELQLPETGAAAEFGFRLREGGEQATVIGYRSAEGILFADRSAAGRNDFSNKFTKLHEASVQPDNGKISLRLLVDESSVEVFADQGTKAFTELIFPDGARDGVSFYAKGGSVEVVSLKVYPLANVWKQAATSGEQASAIRIDRPSYELGIGEERQVYAGVVPYTATNKQLVWDAADSSIAQVIPEADGSATIRAVALGTTTVTVRTVDGTVSNRFTVTVGSFSSNLNGWQSYPESEWVPTAQGIRGFYSSDAAYMSAQQAADFTYEADVTMTERGAGSLLFRANADGTAGYYFNIDPNMRALRLFYKAPGKADVEERMVLANVPGNIAINETFHVKIVAEGISIKAYLNDELVIDVQDDTYNQGYFGLNVFDGYVYYQNVTVTESTPVNTDSYRLTSQLNDRVMSVDSQENFARLKGVISTDSSNEQWILVPLAQGDYSIRTVSSGKALDWDTGQNSIQLYPYLGYDNQRWQLIEQENGTFIIVSTRDTNQALQISNDGSIALAARNEQEDGQRWSLQKLELPVEPGEGTDNGNGTDNGSGTGSGNGTGNNNGASAAGDGIKLLADGKVADYASIQQVKEAGVAVNEITLNAAKLKAVIADRQSVRLDIYTESEAALRIRGLTQAELKQLAALNAELVIHTPSATIPIQPAALSWPESLSGEEGNDTAELELKLEAAQQSLIKQAQQRAAEGAYELLGKPLTAAIKRINNADSGNEADMRFEQYSPVMLMLPAGMDNSSALTVVAIDEEGNASHLPTKIVEMDGKLYALAHERIALRTYAVAKRSISFPDMTSHWASDVAAAMGTHFIMKGDGQGKFLPDERMSRSQFAAIIVRGLGLEYPIAGASGFDDVPADRWDFASVAIAKQFGLMNGFADGRFRGDNALTREQAMVAVYHAIQLIQGKQETALSEEAAANMLSNFQDNAELSGWAREAAAYLAQHGIVQGNGKAELKPGDNLTRAEAAAMLYQLLVDSSFIA